MASAPPALVDLYGRPLIREALTREIAAPSRASVRTIQSGHPAQGLDPGKLASILRAAEDGSAIAYFELAEEMEEKDLHYLSVLGTRKRAVSQLPIEVEPADDSAQAAEDARLVEEWLDRDLLESELFDILDAIGKGVSTVELIWQTTSSLWTPRLLKWRDPRWFEFDRVDGETLLLRGGEQGIGESTPLPAAKFITHFHPAKSGLPIRSGLARIAAWGYMFKNFAIKDWVTFLEAYGHPIRIGKYGPNESEENKRILERALYQLGSDAAAAFPETMSVEFVDRKAGTAPNDLWRSHAEYFDLQISKAVLGQTNTTDAQSGGLGSGQANVHNDVRGDIERADAKLLAATLNRDLVVPLVMLNRGMRDKYPRLKIGRPDPVDVDSMVKSASALAEMGVEIDAEEVRERAGLPGGKPGGKILVPAARMNPDPALDGNGPAVRTGTRGGPDPGKSGKVALSSPLKPAEGATEAAMQSAKSGGGAGSAAQATREPDAIALTTEEALGDWEALINPLLDPVETLIGDCGDLGELQSRLVEALENMEVGAFATLLAKGQFAARIAGLAGPQPAGD